MIKYGLHINHFCSIYISTVGWLSQGKSICAIPQVANRTGHFFNGISFLLEWQTNYGYSNSVWQMFSKNEQSDLMASRETYSIYWVMIKFEHCK